MQLIDTHCHIYLEEFDADQAQMIDRARQGGVSRMLMPAIDSKEHEAMMRLASQYPEECLPMMGLHPCSVKENFEHEFEQIRQYYERNRFIAVGETGLDFYWDLSFKAQQYEIFHRQIELALHYDIPIVIHSRESIDECIDVVTEHQQGQLKGVFHCFSGSETQAKKIIDLGFYLGIGGVLTFKKAGLDKVMKGIGLEQVVLETDAPYLAPVPFRGKRNECAYLKYTAQKLADVKEISFENVAAITTSNAKNLFQI